MKNVLVMGGSYFIGKKIVSVLCDKGFCVTVLNRGTKQSDKRAASIVCDRNNKEQMKSSLFGKSFDTVIDVCGVNANQIKILCESIDISVLEGFVFISSSSVYDVNSLTIPFKVGDPLGENVWGEYGTDKIKAEKYLCDRFSDIDVRLDILRPPYVYGEDNYAQRESFVFEHVMNKRPILVPQSNPLLQFIYTGDLAEIIVALQSDNTKGINIYNVGNKKALTSKQWVEACAEVVGLKADIIEYDYKKDKRFIRDFFPFYDYDNILDVSPINEIMSHETAFSDGLENAYKWFLKNRHNIEFKQQVETNERDILKKLGF